MEEAPSAPPQSQAVKESDIIVASGVAVVREDDGVLLPPKTFAVTDVSSPSDAPVSTPQATGVNHDAAATTDPVSSAEEGDENCCLCHGPTITLQ